MKAKIKETGKWITVDTCNEGFYDVETHDVYEPEELILSDGSEWTIFRREAAKDILVAMARKVVDAPERLDELDPDCHAKVAVEWTDALIKQLKEGKQ